ncbi:MAG: cytochrome c [Gemmataceae bacterium]
MPTAITPGPAAVRVTAPPPAAPQPPTASGGMPRWQQAAVIAVPVLAAAAVWAAAVGYYAAQPSPAGPASGRAPDGAALYLENCARCHGKAGQADGPASALLDPPARRFGEDQFRLPTTANGVATDDDLLFVIRNGIPGSAMPKFDHLSDAELGAVLGHVRQLALAGLYQRINRKADQAGGLDPEVIHGLVGRQLSPGQVVSGPGPFPPATPEAVARGQKVYQLTCASCHGPAGRGDGPQVKDLKNDDGTPTRPRDLSKGMYKGGGTPERLYTRILVGMPGTPMPASTTLKPDDICDLVHYVRSLAPAASATTLAP